jgi:hypothetical protein
MTPLNDPERQQQARTLLAAKIAASGGTLGEFARTVLVRDPLTIKRWLRGERPIPAAVLRLLEGTRYEAP